MKTPRSVQLFDTLAIAIFFVCGQQAMAGQIPRWHIKFVPRGSTTGNAPRPTTLPPNLYPLQAGFTQSYPIIGANADGSDIWPCQGNPASLGENPDCPTIGSPSIPFPANAIAVGAPAFVWSLKNSSVSGNGYGCDALIDGTGYMGVPYNPCGQTITWYEDDTNDSTDDFLYSIVVTQGTKTLADSGVLDYGPNTAAGLTPPSDVIVYGDTNFGFGPGDGVGPNNGNCQPDYNYPLTAPANPGEVYLVAAGKTCGEPVAGLATFTATTAVAAPVYTQVTGTACTALGVASPCYTVTWTKKYEICQKWDIWLE